jgi:predicted kinase
LKRENESLYQQINSLSKGGAPKAAAFGSQRLTLKRSDTPMPADMKDEKILILIKGAPCSGKSTVAQRLVASIIASDKTCSLFNEEQYLSITQSPNPVLDERNYLNASTFIVENIRLQFSMDPSCGVFIVDGTTPHASQIEMYQKFAQSMKLKFFVFVLQVPLAVRQSRNNNNNNKANLVELNANDSSVLANSIFIDNSKSVEETMDSFMMEFTRIRN